MGGGCDPRFEPVREAFAANFASGEEIGAAVCVQIEGVTVVDLWGGFRDEVRTRPWDEDTLVNAYSVGKGILAILAANLLERGAIDLDDPVARRWPEFAAGGKGAVTIRQLLAHRAGLPAVRERLPEGAMYDWDRICGCLAGQDPFWSPDSAFGYHVNTYGYLVGEVVRRWTGLDLAEALRRFVTGPANTEFYWGLPRSQHRRVAEIVAPQVQLTRPEEWARAFPATGDAEHDLMMWHAYFNPSGFSGIGTVNTEAWRLAVIPSTNGHTTARGVAGTYAAFLAGPDSGAGFAGEAVRSEFCRVHSAGEDRILRRPGCFGLGFQLALPTRPLGPNPRSFGHFGYGGSLGFGDPDRKLAFGYVMNRPGERWQVARTTRLVDAAYACL